MKSNLTKELRKKFRDLLVTRGGIVLDDEFRNDCGNQALLEKDPELFHRQELREDAESYERREELLESTLDDLQFQSIDFQEIYNSLVWARRQEQNDARSQRGIDARRKFIEDRASCLESYRQAAKTLKEFIETSPYPTRVLEGTSRNSRVVDLLSVIEAVIKDDAVLNYIPRDESGQPLPVRSSRAGRRVKPWMTEVRDRLRNAGNHHGDYDEQLLIAVGLVPIPTRSRDQ